SAGAAFVPGWLRGNDAPSVPQVKASCSGRAASACTPTATPVPPLSPPVCQPDRDRGHDAACAGQPASIQLTPDPLAVHCDGTETATLTVRITDVNGQPVPDG